DVRQLKLIDFGLARVISKELLTRITANQQILGSPSYMAPEQLDGTVEISGAADVYALAGIAYLMLSGQPVFSASSLFALVYAHGHRTPERLSERCPHLELPLQLDELMLACLAKEPRERPSIGELERQLAGLAQKTPASGTGLAELLLSRMSEDDESSA